MTDTPYHSRRVLWQHKLADEVVRGLRDRIRSGDLTAGMPLPDREALARDFVTSETVVDRAIDKLLSEGVATRGPDGAPRVAAFPPHDEPFAIPGVDKATLDDVLAILELRVGIECEAAALAATRHNEATLAAVRTAAEEYAAAARARTTPARADFRFHLSIAEASGNRYYHDLIEYLGPLFIPRMRLSMMRHDPESDAAMERSLAEHTAIVEAIAAGDAAAARDRMRAHLTRSIALIAGMERAE